MVDPEQDWVPGDPLFTPGAHQCEPMIELKDDGTAYCEPARWAPGIGWGCQGKCSTSF